MCYRTVLLSQLVSDEKSAGGDVSHCTIVLARAAIAPDNEPHREVLASGPREGCPQLWFAFGPQHRTVLRNVDGVPASGGTDAVRATRMSEDADRQEQAATRPSNSSTRALLYRDSADPGTPEGARPLRSRARQGFLRRRLHRRHQGPQVASDRRGRAHDPGQSRAPRRGRRRSARRRRRRHPGADPAQVLRPQGRGARHHAAGARRIRHRRAVHAARRRPARAGPQDLRGGRRAGRPDASSAGAPTCRSTTRRSARRSSRPSRSTCRSSSARANSKLSEDEFERRLYILRKSISAAIYRAVRAAAVGLLPGVDVVPHRHLQGHVPRRSARHLLSRPARAGFRERARAGAPALLHQHLPDLVAGASLPDDRAQRRDQHAARQQQLDGGAAGLGVVEALRRRHLASSGRSPTRASPTPPASTTRSNSWCRAATRSRTP